MPTREEILNRKPQVIPKTLKDGSAFYFKRVSYNTARALIEKQRAITENFDNVESMIDWIIAAGVDENGAPLFTEEDRPKLKELDIPFLLDAGQSAMVANTADPQEAEKNS